MSGLIFLAIVWVFAAFIATGVAQSKKTNEAWAAAAKRLQLVFQPGQLFTRPRISGIHHGCSVLVTTFSRGSGKNQTTYTRFRVSFPNSLDLGLRLTRQGLMSGIGKFFGSQDIVVGDEGFDDAVVVKGRDPQRVIEFLTPSRRLRAARFLSMYQNSVIDDMKIEWHRRHVERDPDKIARILERMTTLVNHMTDDRAENESIDKALEARQEGRLDEALEMIRGVPHEQGSDAADMLVFEGEILLATRQTEAAAKTFSEVHDAEPEDDEAFKLAEQASRNVEPTEESDSDEEDLEVRHVCERLFDPSMMSSQTNEIFDSDYRNRSIRWSGTLKSIRSFTFDLVFGNQPGTRAVFEIHRVGGSQSFSMRPVQAVVQLAPEDEEGLRSKLERDLVFEGRLVSVDAFMRNLFVAGGVVVER